MDEEQRISSIQEESRHHDYRGNAIPWFVRLMWVGFWIFAITYAIRWMFPAMRSELFSN